MQPIEEPKNPLKDGIALASAIKKLIDNPELRTLMGERGRCFAETKFDLKDVVKKHLMIYQNSISSTN